MTNDNIDSFLWWLTLSEVLFLITLLLILAGNIMGYNQLFSSVSYNLKIIGVLFLITELLIPFSIYIDIKNSNNQVNSIWIHASAIPIVNITGFIAYIIQKNKND